MFRYPNLPVLMSPHTFLQPIFVIEVEVFIFFTSLKQLVYLLESFVYFFFFILEHAASTVRIPQPGIERVPCRGSDV